jgi:hypothetical protein
MGWGEGCRWLIEKTFAKSARHYYEDVSSPGGVKFLGGGLNEGCEHESCQAFLRDELFYTKRYSNGNLVTLSQAKMLLVSGIFCK